LGELFAGLQKFRLVGLEGDVFGKRNKKTHPKLKQGVDLNQNSDL
jgi:hypothetical protein